MTDTETVVIMPNSYGSGNHTEKAFRNALKHLAESRIEGMETVTVGIYTVKGEYEITERGSIRAEEFLDEKEVEVRPEDLIEIREITGQVGVMIEELCTDEEISDATRDRLNEVMQ